MCRSRQELSNAYLLAKFGFDTAENEPSEVCVSKDKLTVVVHVVQQDRTLARLAELAVEGDAAAQLQCA